MDSSASLGRFARLVAEMPAQVFGWFSAPSSPVSATVRQRLLETTYDRKAALVFASLSTLIVAISVISIAGAVWPLGWIAVDAALLAVRMRLIRRCESARARGDTGPLGALMAVGALWATVFGLGCYGCVESGHIVLAVLGALNVAGVSGIISSRNAATPRFAILVMLLVDSPYTAGAVMSPIPGMFVIGIQMPFYVAGVIVVLLHNHLIAVRMIQAELHNRDLAVRDALTGLPNRIILLERLDMMCVQLGAQSLGVQSAAGSAAGFAVLSMDLDGFKVVNDSYGHAAGDALLCRVGERLTRAFRSGDVVARMGGDEFVVLLPRTGEQETAYLAKRAIEKVSVPFDIGVGAPVSVGLSVGSALAPTDGDSAKSLLSASDAALYHAKRGGKGRHTAHMRRTG